MRRRRQLGKAGAGILDSRLGNQFTQGEMAMRNTTIRKAVLAVVIGVSSMVSPIAAQALMVTRTPMPCQSCSVLPILASVLAPQA
jgi:hypothetical protein